MGPYHLIPPSPSSDLYAIQRADGCLARFLYGHTALHAWTALEQGTIDEAELAWINPADEAPSEPPAQPIATYEILEYSSSLTVQTIRLVVRRIRSVG
jgi:hypothetical protein